MSQTGLDATFANSERTRRARAKFAPDVFRAANDDDPDANVRAAEDAAFGLVRSAPHLSARARPNFGTGVAMGAEILALTFIICVAPHETISVLVAAAALFFLCAVVFRLALFLAALDDRARPAALPAVYEDDLPSITVMLPVYREKEGLPILAEAMRRLDYPRDKLDFKLLLEPDDRETFNEARRLGLDRMFEFVFSPAFGPKTKPKACNAGLVRALGEFVVIYDAEDAPEPDQLKKAAAAFAVGDSSLACVQARLNFYNKNDNLLTGLFALEFALWFDFLLPGLQRLGMPIPLGGTSNIFRTEILRAVGGWDPFNVAEDADLGLRLARLGYRTEILDSTTYEEANCRLGNWIRQRSRWMKGYMQTFIVHMRDLEGFHRACSLRGILALHLFVGGNFIGALVAPLIWIAAAAAAFAGVRLNGPVVTINIVALVAGNLLIMALAAAAPARRGWAGLVALAVMAPVYWQLVSLGAWKGLVDLVRRPHHWEKTNHVVSAAAKERRRAALAGAGGVAAEGQAS